MEGDILQELLFVKIGQYCMKHWQSYLFLALWSERVGFILCDKHTVLA